MTRVTLELPAEAAEQLREMSKAIGFDVQAIAINPAQRLANALAVFILDAKIHNWLKANDPKALEQAINAVNGYDPKVIEGKMPRTLSSFAVPHVFQPTEPGSETCQVCGERNRTLGDFAKFHE